MSELELFGLATGSEKALLAFHLKTARDALIFKVEGLSEEERRRPMTPTGTNLIGVVKHMTWIEGWYICEAFGQERPLLAWEWDADGGNGYHSDMYARPDETTEDLLAAYRATTAASDLAIERLDLDATGKHWSGAEVSLRWFLMIVLLDTTRHAGHSDIVRELIDGATGGRDRPGGFQGTNDEEYRAQYLARVRGEIDNRTWFAYVAARGSGWS